VSICRCALTHVQTCKRSTMAMTCGRASHRPRARPQVGGRVHEARVRRMGAREAHTCVATCAAAWWQTRWSGTRRHVRCRAEEGDMAALEVEEEASERMDKSMEAARSSIATVRTGRASTSLLDRVQVNYYGAPTPLRTIAGVTTPDASTLLVQPFDASALKDIERAILESDVGLTPNNDGKIIRLNIPTLTAERRKELTKTVAKLGEDGKVAVRNVRRDAIKKLQKLGKDGLISEDEQKDMEMDIQKMTDTCIKQIDELVLAKEKELTTV